MTVEPSTTPANDRPTRSAALELARLHLRTGALALARAELETLAGRDLLDDPGILDLAEVRWRTGDVAGAGEAVAALLDGGADTPELDDGGSPLAWVIAAEAAAARGRPTEARRHADRVRSTPGATIDMLFAGLPRSSAWPADPLTLAPSDATLFPATGRPGSPGSGHDGGSPRTASTGASSPPPASAAGGAALGAPGFWDVDDPSDSDDAAADELPEIDPELAAVAEAIAATEALAEAEAEQAPSIADEAVEIGAAGGAGSSVLGGGSDTDDLGDDDPDGPDPSEALEEGRIALADGQAALAAMHLSLVLRLAPALAPAVLDALGDADAPELAFVRGDAYRLVGREREARRAYGRARTSSRTSSPDALIDVDPARADDDDQPRP